MEQIELFSPERLRLARQRRGLFKQELAARVDVTPRTVSAWESGQTPPSAANLAALARELEFPREFFFGDAPPILETPAFRALARMTARARDMALAAGSEAVALDLWLAREYSRPKPNVPDLRGATPENAAETVRAAWGVGYKPIANLVHRLEANGIRVYSLVHDGTEINAFSDWQNDTPYIFLNTMVTAERSRMDAAHELGHLVLHAHTGGPTTKQEEDEAQAFASAFLMPAQAVIASIPRRISLATVVEAKQKWGVSALAYVYRLRSLGRLSKWQYDSLTIRIKSTYGRTEPGPERARETSQVLAKVMSPKPAQVRKEIVRELRIPMRNLDEITFGLALTTIQGSPQPSPTASSKRPTFRLVK